MSLRSNIFVLMIVFNVVPLLALYVGLNAWIPSASRRRTVFLAGGIVVLLLNLPLSLFWMRSVYDQLYRVPSASLRVIFYPAVAWQTTALLCTLLLAPVFLIWATARTVSRLGGSRGAAPETGLTPAAAAVSAVSRRKFLAGGAGLLVPAIYGASAYKIYDGHDEVDVSPERTIPLPYLPRAFDGMTIVQLSDLHVGPYIRRRELEHWVSLTNALRPDLVVLTGDFIDRSLTSLPDAVAGLRGLRSGLGVLAILGNHDISSDPYSSHGGHLGGESIVRAMHSVGIRTLRNEVTFIESGGERLAVLGLDWILAANSPGSSEPRGSSFFRYHPEETREQLSRLAAQLPPETPSILLAHHPDTFSEVPPLRIGLTLSGHTHGGGQVVFFTREGKPVGISSARFKYVSGLYQQGECRLYVNRGLGYFGVPVRINCPPEISRFRLTSSPPTS